MRSCKVLLSLFLTIFLLLICLSNVKSDDDNAVDEKKEDKEEEKLDDKDLEYQKGSLCGYCEYCKFCKLCDADCPCERGPGKPNCHMCKYCRYCYLCKVCDSVCQPGGIIDSVTSKIYNALPKINKEEIDDDIKGVKTWIDKKKDEL